MALTSPDNIWTPDSSENYDYVIDSGATATSVQNALTKRANSYTGTTTQRTAFTSSAPEGTLWSDTNGDKILWIKQGSAWVQVWPEEWESAPINIIRGAARAEPTVYRQGRRCWIMGSFGRQGEGGNSDIPWQENVALSSAIPTQFRPTQHTPVTAATTPFGATPNFVGNVRMQSTGIIEVRLQNSGISGDTGGWWPLGGLTWVV